MVPRRIPTVLSRAPVEEAADVAIPALQVVVALGVPPDVAPVEDVENVLTRLGVTALSRPRRAVRAEMGGGATTP